MNLILSHVIKLLLAASHMTLWVCILYPSIHRYTKTAHWYVSLIRLGTPQNSYCYSHEMKTVQNMGVPPLHRSSLAHVSCSPRDALAQEVLKMCFHGQIRRGYIWYPMHFWHLASKGVVPINRKKTNENRYFFFLVQWYYQVIVQKSE